jgi:hypothetical protein
MGSSKFDNVEFGKSTYHVYVSGIAVGWDFNNCIFRAASVSSRYFNKGTTTHTEQGCYTWYNNQGLTIKDNARSVLISNSVFEYNTTNGFFITGGLVGAIVSSVVFNAVYFEGNGTNAGLITTTAAEQTRGFSFIGCYFTTGTATNNYYVDVSGFGSYLYFESCAQIGSSTPFAPDISTVTVHNNYNGLGVIGSANQSYLMTQLVSQQGTYTASKGVFGSVEIYTIAETGATPTLITLNQGAAATLTLRIGNASGNQLYQQWFVSYGYGVGATPANATKLVEQKTDASGSPACTLSISALGVVTLAITTGSVFVTTCDIVGRV